MSRDFTRRTFCASTAGFILPTWAIGGQGSGPIEAPFQRDYAPPDFKPRWSKPQLSRLLVQDFVIFAHSNLDMTKKLLDREPRLNEAFMDWGAGDWESALGGASHMGRRDIVALLLERGARMDIFCATMLGLLDAVKAMLTVEPKLIDARGPHGFTLHFHAQLAGKDADRMIEYLQSIKRIELKPNPFVRPPE
ncbi:MAG TPA: hypothetical protein VM328_11225 [Fimbriimonadaceae bacterium]|nr:hypothetical protein [Fimbriimonadaceae bacterium]